MFKKIIIIWSTTEEAANHAGCLAVESARTLANATAFGNPPVEADDSDPDYDPLVEELQ